MSRVWAAASGNIISIPQPRKQATFVLSVTVTAEGGAFWPRAAGPANAVRKWVRVYSSGAMPYGNRPLRPDRRRSDSAAAAAFTTPGRFRKAPMSRYFPSAPPARSVRCWRTSTIASSVGTLAGQVSTQARHNRQKLTTSRSSLVGSMPPSASARAIVFFPRALVASTPFTPKSGQTGRQAPQRSQRLTIFSASLSRS